MAFRRRRIYAEVGETGPVNEVMVNGTAEMGQRLRRIRAERDLTLHALSGLSGVAISTISKIENGQVSPVYGTLKKLADGLGLPLERLISDAAVAPGTARRTVTLTGEAVPFDTVRSNYSMHAADLLAKAMLPIVMRVHARVPPGEADWSSHQGEEFIFVISGEVDIHLEYYAPIRLGVGESAYIDSRMRHGFVSIGPEEAELLTVSYDPAPEQNAAVPGRPLLLVHEDAS